MRYELSKLNILWISHFVPYPPKGGCFQRNYNLIKEVSSENNVYLIAIRHKDKTTHPEVETNKAKSELEKLCKKVIIADISSFSGLNYYYMAFKSIFKINPLTVNLFKSKDIGNMVAKLVTDIKIDVVHYDTISLCEYMNHSGSVAKILNHHGVESFMVRRRANNEQNLIKKLYLLVESYKLRKYEERYCHKFFINITVSQDDKLMLKKISPLSRIEVVENGVDINFFKQRNNHNNTNRLIFAGRMDQYSNVDAIMQFCKNVWPLVKEIFPNMRFSIIGNNPPQKLLQMARNDERIEVLGYVDDVRPYFAGATMSICPVRDGGGTRLKILDAMAMGMPIISTTIGCEGIDVSPGKNVLIADTPEEFVESIRKLNNDVMLREHISNFARITAENKYSWNIIGQKLNKYYHESACK
jgi:glycosyltransferase involved in cell wall biosynthesis